MLNKFIILIICLVGSVGCSSFLKIYRDDIRQGNYVTDSMLEQLKIGMTQQQVRQIMGSPALIPSTRTNYWYYHYYLKSGVDSTEVNNPLRLEFVNNKLAKIVKQY